MSGQGSTYALDQLVDLQRGTTYKSALLGRPGPVLLGLASIAADGGFKTSALRTYGGECPDKLMLRPGDLYVSLKDVTQSGNLLGSVARVPRYIDIGRLTQDTVKLNLKNSTISPLFLYWVLRSPEYRSYCRARAIGTTNLSLSRDDFLAFQVPRPNASQLALVELLQALEDKMDGNRRIIETLEAIARAVFKDWFVDLGPIHAKIEGRSPYLSSDLWSLFPERLDEDGKPYGWCAGQLDDLLVLQRGFDLPTYARTPGKYHVIAASGFNGTHDEFMVSGPGVTTGRSGVLGEVFFVHDDFWPLNTSLWVKEFKRSSPAHAYFLMQTLDFSSFNGGSAVPSLNRNHVHNLRQIIPSKEIVAAFDHVVMPLLRLQRANELESQTLSKTRDLLLPKLMFGEIRVKEAEKIMAEVA